MSQLSAMQCDQVLKSLRAGVVPADRLDLIKVGREGELETLDKDILHIAKGGSCVRFVTGNYGSGKTFIGELTRQHGIKQGLVVATATLSPDKRLQAKSGETRNLYSALVRSFSTKARPNGSALINIVERFILTNLRDAHVNNVPPETHIAQRLRDFEELAGGFDFITVIQRYCHALEQQDDVLKSTALRWLRGEFTNLTDPSVDVVLPRPPARNGNQDAPRSPVLWLFPVAMLAQSMLAQVPLGAWTYPTVLFQPEHVSTMSSPVRCLCARQRFYSQQVRCAIVFE